MGSAGIGRRIIEFARDEEGDDGRGRNQDEP